MRILFPIILLFAAFIRPAQAFLDLPYVTPANPVAGEAISVNIYGGGCDLADIGVIWPPPVTQDGSDITISLTGIHETDPEWCYFNVGTETYSIGAYPAGSYTLYANRRYTSGSGVWIYETLGIIPFTVTGAVPPFQLVSAPSLDLGGLSVLLLLLASVASRRLRPGRSE